MDDRWNTLYETFFPPSTENCPDLSTRPNQPSPQERIDPTGDGNLASARGGNSINEGTGNLFDRCMQFRTKFGSGGEIEIVGGLIFVVGCLNVTQNCCDCIYFGESF